MFLVCTNLPQCYNKRHKGQVAESAESSFLIPRDCNLTYEVTNIRPTCIRQNQFLKQLNSVLYKFIGATIGKNFLAQLCAHIFKKAVIDIKPALLLCNLN